VRYRAVAIEDPFGTNGLNTNTVYSIAEDISDSGLVTGQAQTTAVSQWAGFDTLFIYEIRTGFLAFEGVPGYGTRGIGINNSGQIAVSAGQTNGEKVFRYSPGVGFQDLGTLGATNRFSRHVAYRINSSGQVVGHSALLDGSYHAFRYTDEIGMEDLGTLGGSFSSAIDINDLGWVCGKSLLADGSQHAFLYEEDFGMMDLGPGNGIAINNQGVIAGVVGGKPVLFRDGLVVPIPFPYGLNTSYGVGSINEGNIVVGGILISFPKGGGSERAVIVSESFGVIELETMIPTNSGWRLWAAIGINNHGQIVGEGSFRGKHTAFLLNPIPPVLRIDRSGSRIVLNWSSPWSGVVLETTTNLSPPLWAPIPLGTNTTVTLPPINTSRFFRLNLDALRGLCCAPQ